MISNTDYKRLCEIDDKMLNDILITPEEFKERTRILEDIKFEDERDMWKMEGVIL